MTKSAILTIPTPDGGHINVRLSVLGVEVVPPAPVIKVDPPAWTPPNCPAQAIIHIYHTVLPEMAKVIIADERRVAHIRNRWREVCTEERMDEEQGLGFFRHYFQMVRKCEFLMGKAQDKSGRKPFIADLEWLMRPTNFRKVLEGKYL